MILHYGWKSTFILGENLLDVSIRFSVVLLGLAFMLYVINKNRMRHLVKLGYGR